MSRTLGLVLAAMALLALVVWLPDVTSVPSAPASSAMELPPSAPDELQGADPQPAGDGCFEESPS